MIRQKLCLLASVVLRDAETNSLSIISLLEGFAPVAIPFAFAQLSCLALWERDRDDAQRTEGTFNIRIDGEPLAEHRFSIDFQGHMQTRTIINLMGVVMRQPGLLTAQMILDTGAIAEYSARILQPVAVVAPPAPAAPVANQ